MPHQPPPEVIDRITSSPRWRRVEHHAVVDSTNAIVAERAAAGAPPGLVVVADRQTAGRGRLDRSWRDQPDGSLAVTALVGDVAPSTLAPLAAGMAVAEAAAAQGVATQLKWPNDVLVDGRKCAGVLIETVPGGFAVGIGVNVDWRRRVEDVPSAWGSLAESLGGEVDRWRLLADLLRAFDGHLDQVQHEPAALVETYRGRCITLGRQVRVELADGVISGTATDVAQDGALLVRSDDRTLHVHAGDVHHVRPAGSVDAGGGGPGS